MGFNSGFKGLKYERSSSPQIIVNCCPACTIKEDQRKDGKDF
jgi:hypothetical protein